MCISMIYCQQRGGVEIQRSGNEIAIYFSANANSEIVAEFRLSIFNHGVLYAEHYFKINVISESLIVKDLYSSHFVDHTSHAEKLAFDQKSNIDADAGVVDSVKFPDEVVDEIPILLDKFSEALRNGALPKELGNIAKEIIHHSITVDNGHNLVNRILQEAILAGESSKSLGQISSGMLAGALLSDVSSKVVVDYVVNQLFSINENSSLILSEVLARMILDVDNNTDKSKVIESIINNPNLSDTHFQQIHYFLVKVNPLVAEDFVIAINKLVNHSSTLEGGGKLQGVDKSIESKSTKGLLEILKEKIIGRSSDTQQDEGDFSHMEAIHTYNITLAKARLLENFGKHREGDSSID